MDRYAQPSTLAAQIEKLKDTLINGEKHCKKLYEDMVEACWEFIADHKVLQWKKVD